MTKLVPIIAAIAPAKVDLEAGKDYFWCQCGKSKSQPFCDGSHAGSDITPLKFVAEKSGPAALCQCKASANAPFCDGTHAGTVRAN
jgi:CDGSH-type Zn-finger protein